MEESVRAGTRRAGGGRGVSLPAFLVTLAVLLLFLLVALEFVNRWTRIPAPAAPAPATRMALDLAVRTLSRDLGAAAAGRLPAAEAIRPVRNNTPSGAAFTGPAGQTTEVRAGTDQIGLRGILRAPPLLLEKADRATGGLFSSPGKAAPGEFQARPASARLKLYADGGPRGTKPGDPDVDGVAALLRARNQAGGRKKFFVAGDGSGGWAVGRIASVSDRTASSAEGCAPAPDGCHLALTLDLTDADAVRLNARGDAGAPGRLGPLAWGGLLDDLVFFVARGPKGRPPDYLAVNDPPSQAYPRPFLAAAENVGGGRWDVARIADDVENLQVAWAVAAGRGAEEWRADRPGVRPLLPEEVAAPGTELRAVRIALVAKGRDRIPARGPDEAAEEFLPFDASRTDPATLPIGWVSFARVRVFFLREVRYLSVRPPPAP
jgi:hypothetical protein